MPWRQSYEDTDTEETTRGLELNPLQSTWKGLSQGDEAALVPARRRDITVILSISCGFLALCCCALSGAVLLVASRQYLAPSTAQPSAAANQQQASQAFPALVDSSREPCSGKNGMLYSSEGTGGCTCFACFNGSTCANEIPLDSCTINSESGTPYLYERYWVQHPEADFRMLPSDNIGYLSFPTGILLPRLDAAIRKMHAQVGNAVTEGRRLVLGVGSSEILMAAMWAQANAAMASGASNGPVQVFSHAPYYSAYPEVASALGSRDQAWTNLSASDLSNAQHNVVEFACAPNNPDGAMQNQTIAGSRMIRDHAYYWPQYTPITQALQYGPQDIAVFTLSKLTGHASSRIGWAIVSDPAVADAMQQYIDWHGNVPIENQARAATLLEHVIGSQGGILRYGRAEMQRRWTLLAGLAAEQERFTFQTRQAAHDQWSGRTETATPPYLWIRCNRERDADCTSTLLEAGIIAREGKRFGASAQFARLSLLMRQEDFNKMALKLEKLMMS